MPAHSDKFPWPSYSGLFKFFEERMQSYHGVASFERLGGGLYEISRRNGQVVRVFVCECYAFGVAEYRESVEHLGPLDVIIINSSWCGYSPDVKHLCRGLKIGVFTIADFMAAFNRESFWDYLNTEEVEYFRKKGWA